ncbi:unnamed protein product [Rotaria sordida]|uniref:Uncharacterized protein n=1 Tax=Rotaria sordida TaxID=392033 RepID=A0A814L0L1_9BILA|nr:unnamed protein product [Rotaria sordida]CAF1056762.1 unnamed protein product [Rotaria sordida]
MAMHNSSPTNNQNDDNATIVNSLFSSDYNYTSINAGIPIRTTNYNRDNFFVKNDLKEIIQQLEQILNYYRQELKQESNAQFNCNRNLITRLIDFIRPVYSLNPKKLKDLDILFNDISDLHDKRFNEQKEKNEQFQKEISHLKKLMITSDNEDNTNRKNFRINSIVDYEEWIEIEEETRKLHNLVKNQQNQINELFKLLSHEETSPFHTSSIIKIIPPDEPLVIEQKLTDFDLDGDDSPPVTRVRTRTDQQLYPGTNILQKPTGEFHLPNTLSCHSLNDILTETFLDGLNNEIQYQEPPTVTTNELPSVSRQLSHSNKKLCPICNYEFLNTVNELEIYTHVETCLISASMEDLGPFTGPKQFECPICNQQFSGSDDKTYREHLSNCYRDESDGDI